jgi:hypothetical protein
VSLYRKARPDDLVVHEPPMVVHNEPVVVHKVVHSRHGRYADPQARKAYRRDWMRAKRATHSKAG